MSAPAPITRLPDRNGTDAPARVPGMWWIAGLVLLVLVALGLASTLMQRPTSTLTGHPDNPQDTGAMAGAQILSEHGVDVSISERTITTLNDPGGVIAIVNPGVLSAEQFDAIVDLGTDLVLIGTVDEASDALAGLDRAPYGDGTSVAAGCSFEVAEVAGAITAHGPTFTGPPGAQECFRPGAGAGAFVVHWRQAGRSITVLPLEVMLNRSLATDGNAALAFRVLGTSGRLTWMVASAADGTGTGGGALEHSASRFWVAGLILAVALAWWRGPRFGRLAVEPLPVDVPASETVRSRAALYRRHRDVPHAARTLRLGALYRMASHVGLPQHAGRQETVGRIAEASRRPPRAVADVLYGPPPNDSAGLSALTHALDTLESEVHRR